MKRDPYPYQITEFSIRKTVLLLLFWAVVKAIHVFLWQAQSFLYWGSDLNEKMKDFVKWFWILETKERVLNNKKKIKTMISEGGSSQFWENLTLMRSILRLNSKNNMLIKTVYLSIPKNAFQSNTFKPAWMHTTNKHTKDRIWCYVPMQRKSLLRLEQVSRLQ